MFVMLQLYLLTIIAIRTVSAVFPTNCQTASIVWKAMNGAPELTPSAIGDKCCDNENIECSSIMVSRGDSRERVLGITALYWSYKGLSGAIPYSIGWLQNLKEL